MKYSVSSAGPAPASLTSAIFKNTGKVIECEFAASSDRNVKHQSIADDDYSIMSKTTFFNTVQSTIFTVEMIYSTENYFSLQHSMLSSDRLAKLFFCSGSEFLLDSTNSMTGPCARRTPVDILGGMPRSVRGGQLLENSGVGHPDPNQAFAAELVAKFDPEQNFGAPILGAAFAWFWEANTDVFIVEYTMSI